MERGVVSTSQLCYLQAEKRSQDIKLLALDPAFLRQNNLLGSVHDVSSGNLEVVHEIVHLLQLGQSNNLEWCLDEAAAEEVDGLGAVLAVADV